MKVTRIRFRPQFGILFLLIMTGVSAIIASRIDRDSRLSRFAGQIKLLGFEMNMEGSVILIGIGARRAAPISMDTTELDSQKISESDLVKLSEYINESVIHPVKLVLWEQTLGFEHFEAISKIERLEHIALNYCSLNNDGLLKLNSAPMLTSLDLRHCDGVCEADIRKSASKFRFEVEFGARQE